MDIPASEGATEPTASLCPSGMSSKADSKPAPGPVEGMLLLRLSAAAAGAAAAAGNAGGALVLSLSLGTLAVSLVIGAMLPSFRFGAPPFPNLPLPPLPRARFLPTPSE
eukprot:6491350-Amphidinium_carterae.1